MKYLLCVLIFSFCMHGVIFAWDGFDAATTDLIEIIPDKIPAPGDIIEVRDYETDTSRTYTVESVTRNRRTMEVMARDADGDRRIFVMESR